MVNLRDLRRASIFNEMSDEMIHKLIPIARVQAFKEKESIYEPGMAAQNLYVLLKGKVLLEERLSQSMTISFASIKPGYFFGWQAMIPGAHYSSFAVCAEDSEVIALPGQELLDHLDHDPLMGYIFMRAMTRILLRRLDHRELRLLRVLARHPELERFLDVDEGMEPG